jgi:hypothetical protein
MPHARRAHDQTSKQNLAVLESKDETWQIAEFPTSPTNFCNKIPAVSDVNLVSKNPDTLLFLDIFNYICTT